MASFAGSGSSRLRLAMAFCSVPLLCVATCDWSCRHAAGETHGILSEVSQRSTSRGGPPWRACEPSPHGHTVVSLGGSNTGGANALETSRTGATRYGRHLDSFGALFSQMLQSNGTRHRLAMRADGGSSPMFAGACASQFVPSNTIAGTVEYLPNIGYVKDDEAETGAIGNILRKLRDNGALAFAINIVSGSARWQRDHRPGSICSRLNVPAISAPLTSP